MGGNLAASVCQLFRQGGEPQPVLQLLICPLLDAAGEEPSMTTYAGAWPLGTAEIRWFLSHYMGAGDSPDDPRLSPLREPDLAGLAPALIACAGFDPLLDQSEAYARKLAAAQTACVYRCYDALPHGFTAFIDLVPAAEAASRDIAAIARDFLAVEAP